MLSCHSRICLVLSESDLEISLPHKIRSPSLEKQRNANSWQPDVNDQFETNGLQTEIMAPVLKIQTLEKGWNILHCHTNSENLHLKNYEIQTLTPWHQWPIRDQRTANWNHGPVLKIQAPEHLTCHWNCLCHSNLVLSGSDLERLVTATSKLFCPWKSHVVETFKHVDWQQISCRWKTRLARLADKWQQ